MQWHSSDEPSLAASHLSTQIKPHSQKLLQNATGLRGGFFREGYASHDLRSLGSQATADGGREL